MSNRTIKNSQLTPDTSFYIRGKLSYGRLTSKIEGEELKKDNDRRLTLGMISINRPYTTATINNAQVLITNPSTPTIEQIYAQESLYTTKNANDGYSYTGMNKGNKLPWIAVRNKDGSVQQIKPEGELDKGLEVTLCMRIFSVKNMINKGISLEGVIVEEPIRYYGSQSAKNMLSDIGITFIPDKEAEEARKNHSAKSVDEKDIYEEEPLGHQINQNLNQNNNHENQYAYNSSQTNNAYQTTEFNEPMTQENPFSNNGIRTKPGMQYAPDEININTGNRNY